MANGTDPVIAFATRYSTSTIAVPAIAVAIRHPNDDSAPNSAIPAPISNLPSGGCTTKLPVVVNVSVSPARKLSFASSGHVRGVAQDPLGPRILHVVRLVEHEGVRVPEIPQPEDAGEKGDEGGRQPRPPPREARIGRDARGPPVVERGPRPGEEGSRRRHRLQPRVGG